MESSGQGPAEPEVPLADAAIAAEIARAAAKGRGADRSPTLEQLLAAFGEHAPTDAARRRVRAALRVSGMGSRPDLLEAEPGQRLLLLPPSAAKGGPSRSRALGGLLALAGVLVAAIVAASLLDGGKNGGARVSDSLPDRTDTTTVASTPTSPTSAPTTEAATSAAPGATVTTPAPKTTTTVTPAPDPAAEARRRRRAREKRAATARAKAQKAKDAAAARKVVTVRVDASVAPTFLCVDDGKGNQLFGGTLSGKKTFKGRHVRLNIGLRSTRVTVNGTPVTLNGSPAGLDVTRKGGARDLPDGQRPCG
jgi:hypothetical protein